MSGDLETVAQQLALGNELQPRPRVNSRADMVDQRVLDRQRQIARIDYILPLAEDPRWKKLMEDARVDMEQCATKLLESAGDSSTACNLAGQIQVLRLLVSRRDQLLSERRRLEQQVGGLQEQRREAEIMDVVDRQPTFRRSTR